MSRENVEVVRRLYEAGARRDVATVLALYDPEVEFDDSATPPGQLRGGRVLHGHEGVRSAFREYYEAWEDIEDDCEELIDAGDKVISIVTTRGRGKASGAAVERRHYGVWTIRKDRVVRVEFLPSREAALEAAGFSE